MAGRVVDSFGWAFLPYCLSCRQTRPPQLHIRSPFFPTGACISQRDRRGRNVLDYSPAGSEVRRLLQVGSIACGDSGRGGGPGLLSGVGYMTDTGDTRKGHPATHDGRGGDRKPQRMRGG